MAPLCGTCTFTPCGGSPIMLRIHRMCIGRIWVGWRPSTAVSLGVPLSVSGRLPAQSMTTGMEGRKQKLIVTCHHGLCGVLWRGAMGPSFGIGTRTLRSGPTSVPTTNSVSIGRTCRSLGVQLRAAGRLCHHRGGGRHRAGGRPCHRRAGGRQCRSRRQVLSHRQDLAPMIISFVEIGPPVDSARRTPATCWKLVVRAVVSALPRRCRRQVLLSRRQDRALMITSSAEIGPPADSARRTLATCWKLVLRAAVCALAPRQFPRQEAAVAAGSEQTAAIAAKMALAGATSLLPIVPSARAPSIRVVRLRPLARVRRFPIPCPFQSPRQFLRRFLRQGAVVAAGSEQTAAIAAKMALGGATNLLPTVPDAQAPSTRVARPRLVAAVPGDRGPSQLQFPQPLRGHPLRN